MTAGGTDSSLVCAVLLAAGSSRRFGGDNKLLAKIGGVPLVRRVVERILASSTAGVIVVTGFEGDKIREALAGLDIHFVKNTQFAEGLASSLRCGIAALPEEAAGAMIVLADMPGVTTELIDRLIGAFEQGAREKIIFPTRGRGVQGNPVIWPRRFFAELQTLTGDTGAKRLLGVHDTDTLGVPVEDEDALRDIDRPEDMTGWRGNRSS